MTPPSKRPSRCDGATGPSKKARTVQPAQEERHDSNESSAATLDKTLQPSPAPPRNIPNPLQTRTDTKLDTCSIGPTPSLPSNDTTKPHRNRHPRDRTSTRLNSSHSQISYA